LKARILLVEDDETDIMFVKRFIKSHKLNINVVVARDGIEALEILTGAETHSPLEKPYIVITDINMPGMSGHELIKSLRETPSLKRSVIFVLTSSLLKSDIQLAYDLNIAGYFVKDDDGIADCISLLTQYCSIATLEMPA